MMTPRSLSPIQQAFCWIPTVYLMQGLPFAFVTLVSAVLYKNLGFSNSEITLVTSLFILPWILKFLIAPALETLATKRKWIIMMQFTMAGLILLLAMLLWFSHWFISSIILFSLIAFAAAIHDINSDGLYLEALDYQIQSYFIGIRSVFYQVGRLLCQCGLLFVIGLFAFTLFHWQMAFVLLACVIFAIASYHQLVLPKTAEKPLQTSWSIILNSYRHVWLEFINLSHLLSASIFVLFFNVAEGELNKIIPLFMLDKASAGGLGLTTADVGIISGGIGVGCLLLGNLLSGFLLNKFSLKKCLIPFTLLTALANSTFLILKLTSTGSFWQISLAVAISEFFYGLSNGAYMMYLITLFAKGHYSMSLYAIGTAIMLLGIMLAGAVSGYLQNLLGYTGFFTWILFIGLIMIGLAIYNVRRIL